MKTSSLLLALTTLCLLHIEAGASDHDSPQGRHEAKQSATTATRSDEAPSGIFTRARNAVTNIKNRVFAPKSWRGDYGVAQGVTRIEVWKGGQRIGKGSGGIGTLGTNDVLVTTANHVLGTDVYDYKVRVQTSAKNGRRSPILAALSKRFGKSGTECNAYRAMPVTVLGTSRFNDLTVMTLAEPVKSVPATELKEVCAPTQVVVSGYDGPHETATATVGNVTAGSLLGCELSSGCAGPGNSGAQVFKGEKWSQVVGTLLSGQSDTVSRFFPFALSAGIMRAQIEKIQRGEVEPVANRVLHASFGFAFETGNDQATLKMDERKLSAGEEGPLVVTEVVKQDSASYASLSGMQRLWNAHVVDKGETLRPGDFIVRAKAEQLDGHKGSIVLKNPSSRDLHGLQRLIRRGSRVEFDVLRETADGKMEKKRVSYYAPGRREIHLSLLNRSGLSLYRTPVSVEAALKQPMSETAFPEEVLKTKVGIKVDRVKKGTFAEQFGLKPNDVIYNMCMTMDVSIMTDLGMMEQTIPVKMAVNTASDIVDFVETGVMGPSLAAAYGKAPLTVGGIDHIEVIRDGQPVTVRPTEANAASSQMLLTEMRRHVTTNRKVTEAFIDGPTASLDGIGGPLRWEFAGPVPVHLLEARGIARNTGTARAPVYKVDRKRFIQFFTAAAQKAGIPLADSKRTHIGQSLFMCPKKTYLPL